MLAALFYRFGLADVLEICLRADRRLLLAGFLLYTSSQVVSALRWHRLAAGVGFQTPFVRCLRYYFIGMFFGLAVPSTLGADAARALHLGREPPGRAKALSSVVFDRWIGLVTLVAVGVAALLLGPRGDLPGSLVMALVSGGALLIVLWLFAPALARILPERWRVRRLIDEDLMPYFRDPRLLGTATLLSLGVHAFQILGQQALAGALGLSVSFGFVAIYHPLVALAAAVPITVGGFGLREAMYAYVLPHAGVAPSDAVALGLLWWAVGAASGTIGGIVYAFEKKPQERTP